MAYYKQYLQCWSTVELSMVLVRMVDFTMLVTWFGCLKHLDHESTQLFGLGKAMDSVGKFESLNMCLCYLERVS